MLSYFFAYSWAERIAKNLPSDVKSKVKSERIDYVNLAQINPYVPEAAISSQDERFYQNWGVDLEGTVRAVYFSLVSKTRQGASTITEQLAKNIYYSDQDTPLTDIKTKILALYITNKFSKQSILEWYLNIIYFGKHSYGIGAASNAIFNKSPKDLSLGESAYLIGLTNLPGFYETHHSNAILEAKVILGSMVRNGYISQVDADNSFVKLQNEEK